MFFGIVRVRLLIRHGRLSGIRFWLVPTTFFKYLSDLFRELTLFLRKLCKLLLSGVTRQFSSLRDVSFRLL